MKRKNMISMVTSLALVGVVAVGGTLALLTSQSNDVVNTFTVGKGYNDDRPDLKLDEADVDQVVAIDPEDDTKNIGDYVENTDARVRQNRYANLVEDAKMAKDPQFHIDPLCEVATSWIVAKIDGFNTNQGASTTLMFTKVEDELTASVEDGTEVKNGDYRVVAGAWYRVTKNLDGEYVYTEVTEENKALTMGNGIYIYNQGLGAGQSTEDLFQQLQVNAFVPGVSPSQITVTGYAVEGVVDVDFDNMKDKVMTQVNDWAFGA